MSRYPRMLISILFNTTGIDEIDDAADKHHPSHSIKEIAQLGSNAWIKVRKKPKDQGHQCIENRSSQVDRSGFLIDVFIALNDLPQRLHFGSAATSACKAIAFVNRALEANPFRTIFTDADGRLLRMMIALHVFFYRLLMQVSMKKPPSQDEKEASR